jgi:AraC family transcriptional regulator of adaptative response/methylated-DNA-[protein]-cysteine methyltransferase
VKKNFTASSGEREPAAPAKLDTMMDQTRWTAVVSRTSAPFFYAVRTTGVFCRTTCGARLPRPENVEFFDTSGEAIAAGFRPCLRCQPVTEGAETKRVSYLCRYIERNCADTLSLDALSRVAGVSASHVQRTFQEAVGISPRDYIDACRMRLFRQTLRRQVAVTRAMVDAGYSSTSRLYERTNQAIGMTPTRYRSGAPDVTIRYAIAETQLGWVIVAATDIGICCIQLAGERDELLPLLAEEFPKAALQEDAAGLAAWMASVAAELGGTQPGERLPLDIRATAFQQRVWNRHALTAPSPAISVHPVPREQSRGPAQLIA